MDLFRSPITIKSSSQKINYKSSILLMGSCFSEHIGNYLQQVKFKTDNNPFGIVYNPVSIAHGLNRLLENKEYAVSELNSKVDLWFSFDHHGRFSNTDKEVCLSFINQSYRASNENLKNSDFVFLTFGTAYAYYLKASGKIVANCHKIPEKDFIKKRLEVDEIVEHFLLVISELRKINPDVWIVFTISPVRHWKDGAHENQLSKSILFLAVERICEQVGQTFYFPAYEIMMDELRDYRFYEEDMFHPNSIATKYIWNKFVEVFMDATTISVMKEVTKINAAKNHRPFNVHSREFLNFVSGTLKKIDELQQKYDVSMPDEQGYFQSLLK